MEFRVKIPSIHDREIDTLQSRLGGMDRGEMAVLGLELLEVVSRHLQNPGAQVWLRADGAISSLVDVAQILREMGR